MSRGTLLCICTANECRSALAHVRLAHALAGRGVRVSSAGLRAHRGNFMCSIAAASVAPDLDLAELAAAHRAQLLTVELVRDADLILVATIRQRAVVAGMEPTAMPRLFTYREAAGLLAVPDRTGSGAVDASSLAADPTSALVDRLNRSRGLAAVVDAPTAIPVARRRAWTSRPDRPSPDLDIPDAHSRGGDHRLTLAATTAAIAAITAAFPGDATDG